MSGGEWVAILLGCGVIAALIASARGASAFLGFLLGFFLGLIGIIITLFLKPSSPTDGRPRRECPHCKEQMRADASVCPHCHRDSVPWILKDGEWYVENPNGSTYRYDQETKTWVAP